MITLYDFQKEALAALTVSPANALCVLPMGSGKSVIIDALCKQFPNEKKLILVERIELLEQLGEDVGAESIYCASLNSKVISNLTIATIQSIKKTNVLFDIIIIDEAHKFTSKAIYAFLGNQICAKIYGFTATPYGATGFIYGENKIFASIAYQKSFEYMIANKYLVPLKMKSLPDAFIVDKLKVKMGDYAQSELDGLTKNELKLRTQVVDALSRLSGRNKVIWFCINIAHAEKIKELIGESVATIHSKLSDKERVANFQAFKHGNTRHLTFVTVIAEGINIPAIDAVVVMRPTQSAALLFQTVGRGMRTHGVKQDCLVLDYSRAFSNCGTFDKPNVVNTKGKKNKKAEPSFWVCSSCYEYVLTTDSMCVCGAFKPKTKLNLNNLLETLDYQSKSEEIINVNRMYFMNQTSRTGKEMKVLIINNYVKIYFMPQEKWSKAKLYDVAKQLKTDIYNLHKLCTPVTVVLEKKNNFYEFKEARY